ncbi:HGR003Wp [Eremothecium sinecaudum]|uniref:Nuclear pore protein n=1 Tax=Eremothecium sinecaudum TaxID=45286 RepID=A0A0X8HVL3_9SACH|nr:HGR003Wp [Eremothecium sinecaudum]AMD22342.1 HGR003Wp [Eremothecium sinecaudum]
MANTIDTSALKSVASQDAPLKGVSKTFNDLIETSKNLPSTSSELGSVLLNVNEIRKRAAELRAKNTELRSSHHTRAHYLLAGSGLAIQDVESSLKVLESRQLLEQNVHNKILDGDLDTYLRNKKDENILSSIEQSLSLAAKDFDNFVNANFNLDWKQRKEEVRSSFLGIMWKNDSAYNASAPVSDSSVVTWPKKGSGILDGESKLNINENYVVREKFERYARIVNRFNNARQSNNSFPFAKEFIDVFDNSADSKHRQLLEAWKFLDFYHSEADSMNVVEISKKYLENQFMEYVDTLYKKNRNGGLPTNINKVKSFIESKLKNPNNTWKFGNLTVVNGIPVWALIFYLLRAGLAQEALEVAINNKLSLKKVEQSFLAYFKAYVASKDKRLPQEFVTRLHTEYNQHIKNSLDGDPFRLAVYKIIGRCDLTRKNISTITLSVEDWMWVHFMLIKDDIANDDPVYERYSLLDFQNIITTYGSASFSNNYLQVLLLSGQYELAVQYAYSINELDAVHLAIALADAKLLRVTDNVTDDEFSVTPNNERRVNFAKILGNYTKSFKFSDPRIAVEYLLLIALVDDKKQVELAHEALRELVLETKEFTILLGKINRDGTRIPGIIEERQPLLFLADKEDFLHKITEQAARRADEDGRVHDSLLLYQLSEEYDIVISIVNKLLSEMLSNTDLDQPLLKQDDNNETNPFLIAKKLIDVYIKNLEISKKVHRKNKETCILLLKLVDIRRTYIARQYQNTLNQIEELDLLPSVDSSSPRKKAQEFRNLDECIIKNIPNLLIIAMSCVSNLIKQLGKGPFVNSATEAQIEALRRVANNYMIYRGMIQYKMPREVYNALINLEIGI